ncbi:MAG TPA: GNAT family N-acetyltransferase [Burkholderiaceae bacterium]|nr:GNAT family N-acetyltransferase [Burkholderiaceae bacterium]
MQALLTDAALSDAVESAASVDMYEAAPPEVAAALGVRALQIDGATVLLAKSLADPTMNRVIGIGVDQEASEDALDSLIEMFDAERVDRYWIHVSPMAQPAALPQWLRTRRFAPPRRRSWVKLICHTDPVVPPRSEFQIRPARADDANAVAATICESFGWPQAQATEWLAALVMRPSWQTFVACDGVSVIGAGLLYIDAERKAAWLGMGAVRDSHRGRGAQRALIVARVRAALEAGCDSIVSETGDPIADEPNPSLHNLQRCGFERVVSRLNYAAPSRASSGSSGRGSPAASTSAG